MSATEFTVPEMNLVAIYKGKTRGKTIQSIVSVLNNINDKDMTEIMLSTIEKLANITDKEFNETNFIYTD